MREPKMYN